MRSRAREALAVMVVLILAGLACSGLSLAPAAGSPGGAISKGPTLLKDDFSSSDSGWGTGTDANSSIEYEKGVLHMKIFKQNYFTWSNPDTATYEKVHLEVTVKNQNGNVRAGFGIMCDQQTAEASYYYFAIAPDGEYVIGKSATGAQDVFLTNKDSWAVSDLITKNAPSYRLGADCGAGGLALYVDGKKIDSVTDSSYTKGGVGLFLWSGNEGGGDVLYDDFEMTQLK